MSSHSNIAEDRSAVAVRRMSLLDVSDVLAILMESQEAAQWSEEGLAELLFSSTAWVAERGNTESFSNFKSEISDLKSSRSSSEIQNGHVAGFLIGRVVADEFEILNMAVARAHRLRSVGTRLVSEALNWSRAAGARRAYLEVRASNHPAISLYSRHGFIECGRRAHYYAFPTEDAVVFSLDMSQVH